jgi:hypothetical protein
MSYTAAVKHDTYIVDASNLPAQANAIFENNVIR